ncbi:hypothetical protein ACQKNX_06125 [Lysinibacillus sp. NPDC093712]|uniref:hypothetical protein n=1 Tax=Lysinibacillus sp. NPDC093712 TaxID=3390579 RepID=UPI003D07F847
MKKSYTKFEKIRIVFGVVLLLLVLLGFRYAHLKNIAMTIVAIIMLVTKIQDIKKGKKTISDYLLLGLWILLTIAMFLTTVMEIINS